MSGERSRTRSIRTQCVSPVSPTRRSTEFPLQSRRSQAGLPIMPKPILPATGRNGRPSWSIARRNGWDPLLAWARRRFDVDFSTTTGLIHVPQPAATVERLAHAVAALDPYQLAGLSPLVTVGGSLIAALAVFERSMSPAEAWLSVSVDDRWQLEQWGSDADAELALANHRADFLAGARFLELLG